VDSRQQRPPPQRVIDHMPFGPHAHRVRAKSMPTMRRSGHEPRTRTRSGVAYMPLAVSRTAQPRFERKGPEHPPDILRIANYGHPDDPTGTAPVRGAETARPRFPSGTDGASAGR
jgi:hypothetical protein